MKKHSEYIERNDLKGATHLEVSIHYNIGGANYLRGGYTPRGFYVNVTPVTKKEGSISFVVFSGASQLLMEVKRYSDKQFDLAVEKSKSVIPTLIEEVLEKNKAA